MSSLVNDSDIFHAQGSSETHPVDQPAAAMAAASHEEEEDDYAAGLTARQKSALGFIWFMSAMYAIMTDQVINSCWQSLPKCVQCSAKRQSLGLLSSVPALACVFCQASPATFTQPGVQFFAQLLNTCRLPSKHCGEFCILFSMVSLIQG